MFAFAYQPACPLFRRCFGGYIYFFREGDWGFMDFGLHACPLGKLTFTTRG